MPILDKVKSITNIFTGMFNRRSYSGGYYNDYQSPGIFQVSKEALIAFVEKYKGVRRIILTIVLWINVHIFLVTTYMYKLHGKIDVQWVIFAGYWAGILGTFVAFYTMSRVREFNSATPYSNPGQWMDDSQDVIQPYDDTQYAETQQIDGDAVVQGDRNVGNQ